MLTCKMGDRTILTDRQREFRANLIAVIFWAVVFIGFFVYFTFVHPLYVYDTDDWLYIIPQRKAIPIWKNWNPTRVLPETLMPLVAELGIRFFMPINGDYIGSMAIAFALALSAFYATYFILLYQLSARKLRIPTPGSLMLGTFLLVLHFLPFMKTLAGNAFMYVSSMNVTCVFYFTIPALLNASLVLLFVSRDYIEKANVGQMLKEPKLWYGILLLMVYLAINSNMYQSILLIAYIASTLLIEYIKGGVKSFLDVSRKNIMWLGVIFVWLLSLLMESQGGRAASVQFSGSFLSAVGETVIVLVNTIKGLNSLYIFIFIAIESAAFILFLFSRKTSADGEREYVRLTVIYLISLLVTVAYLVLLCARTGGYRINRGDIFSGILFYVMMLVWTSLVYVMNKSKALIIIMPIVIYILLFETIFNAKSYREINTSNYSSAVVEQISNDILEQILLADSQGQTAMELYVPVYDSNDNWPICTYGGKRISRTLFAHGMIGKEIEITIVPTYDMNEKYNLQ